MPVEESDAFHEAGHSTIGVVRNQNLTRATATWAGDIFPHCEWDSTEYDDLMAQKNDPAVHPALNEHTENFALMCLAAQYAEALCGSTDSPEQKQAIHCDYLDAQRRRRNTGFDYFYNADVNRLCAQAKALVTQYAAAITAVATRLRAVESLDHDQVAAIIAANPPVEPAVQA
jgi:hypothetical protein